MTALAPTLQAFFTDRLIRQRHATSHTVAAYRDTLRMLVSYATAQTGVAPSRLDFDHLDAPAIGAFLDHLEHERGNSVRTRNARLAAIHSLFRFAALLHPEHAASISRVLAIPPKRCDRALITYLTDEETATLLAAPKPDTWTGRRDRALLLLAIQTGLRISELTGLTIADVHLGVGAHVVCHGKGRKDRITPLTAETAHALRAWLAEHTGQPAAPLFPGHSGQRLSRDAIEHRIAIHAKTATRECPSLQTKQVTAHVLRHTTAMRLLHAGIDIAVIALWLGCAARRRRRIARVAGRDERRYLGI
jgi:integrase/recombinase XerD